MQFGPIKHPFTLSTIETISSSSFFPSASASPKPAEITIDAFDKEGNIIINVSNALGVRILIPGFYINKQGLGSDIKFLIESGKLKKWKK